jgi:predicted DNA-binding protein YlxM (UPF0122 family)
MHADGATGDEIAEELGLHKNTVYAKVKKYKSLIEKREQEQENEIADLLKQLQGDTPKEIVSKILNIMNNQEALELEFLERGLDPLNRVLGTISDKIIKLHEIEQKQQMLEEQEVAQDNFFNAMTKALERLTDVEGLVDEASLDDE